MKVLITGSSGTIGTRLCEKMLEQKCEVVGIDLKRNEWHEKVDKITILGDLLEEKTIEKLPKDADVVVHPFRPVYRFIAGDTTFLIGMIAHIELK